MSLRHLTPGVQSRINKRLASASAHTSLVTAVQNDDVNNALRLINTAALNSSLLNKPIASEKGKTLLHLAVQRGSPQIVHALLVRGADANALDDERKTPIQYLPLGGNDEISRALMKAGAVDPKFYSMVQPTAKKFNKETEIDTDEYVDQYVMRKLFLVFLFPFAYLIFCNGLFFALKFTIFAVSLYLVALGAVASSISVKPPWYHPRPGKQELTMVRLAAEWLSKVHDPLTDFGLPFESVEFVSPVGKYTLRGWYIEAPKDKQKKMAIVFGHGGGRDRRSWMRLAPMFHRAGYSCLLFDFREHGLSDGSVRGMTYGMYERFDVVAAAKWMRDVKKFKRIAAVGTSVGGASVIMGAAIAPLDIDVVVAENPVMGSGKLQRRYIHNIIAPYFCGERLHSRIAYNLFQAVASVSLAYRIGNIPSKKCEAADIVHTLSPRPIFLLHGMYDETVPHSHSQKLFELAKEPKELWLAPEGTHCAIFDKYKDEYEEKVIGFLNRYEHSTP